MASVATVTGGPIAKEEEDKGEEGLLFLLEVAGFEQVASSLAFWGQIVVFGGHCHVFSVRWRCQRVERRHNNSRGFYLDQY